MNNPLAKQFSKFLSSGDFYAANKIIEQARTLNYPDVLIKSWVSRLASSCPSLLHPLDAVSSPNQDIYKPILQLDPNLRGIFTDNLLEYCKKITLDLSLIDQIVELVFDNFDLATGKIILPDLTSNKPTINLFHYTINEYSIDNPDVPEAVERGVCPSVADHFLRYGYIEILEGRRHSSLSFSHEKKKYQGNLLYIVDNYDELNESERLNLKSLQLSRLNADVLSVQHSCVYTHNDLCINIEQYLFYNISNDHNLCILLKGKILTHSAAKWIIDIKLQDRTAIFGYSANNGRFSSVTEYAHSNMLVSDITNGCLIANSIEVLAVASMLNNYQSAYGYFHALVLQLEEFGVEFCLKKEILSQSFAQHTANNTPVKHTYRSPFFWQSIHISDYDSHLLSIRRDLVKTWQRQIDSIDQSIDSENSNTNIRVDCQKLFVTLNPSSDYAVGVVIPFKDKIHLLEDCLL